MLHQRTLRRPVHAIGVGVHSGTKARVTLRAAPADTGICFHRTDIAPNLAVPALATNVSDTLLSTSVSAQGIQVATVEHLMSAFWGLGIDNARVEIQGEEVPILDGSAAPFVRLIESAGVTVQSAPKQFIRIKQAVHVSQGDARAALLPHPGFRVAYTFVADHPVYNRYPKRAVVDFATTSYVAGISRARSFGLVRELAQAQAIRKCLGSSLENAVGIDDVRILNEEGLRFRDEFVKHKVLDAIGDLYLLGRAVIGAFEGFKSGHGLNNQLARALLRCPDSWDVVTASCDPVGNPMEPPLLRLVPAAHAF